MSFITRCPACGTAFKVVADQLKISEGWVRCGQCQHIFDATLDLQPWLPGAELVQLAPELDPDASLVMVHAGTPEVAPESFSPSFAEIQWPESELVGQQDTGSPTREEPESVASVSPWAASPETFDWPDTPRQEPSLEQGLSEVPQAMIVDTVAELEPAVFEADAWAAEPVESLTFVQQAQRRAFWQRSGVRAALVSICVLLALLLLGQWTLLQRHVLVDQVPALRPALQVLCRPLGCEVGAMQQLEAVSIDSSALLRRAPDRYAFDMVVKNAGHQPVATPALELTLTDSTDRVLVRRVFLPVQWPQARAVLAPRSEWPVRLELILAGGAELSVVGYRAVLFYP